ncbi:DUF2953 domain-containing protein [Shouchella patagoniensis]|uniref:DUF2953 domain-containing protein n=1 Tax=Shouchella patagoniensis TaxID=228576 RepID=UPI0009952E23|nr:DUF2953 domain-containing protein [Shouchella patagoniensis]
MHLWILYGTTLFVALAVCILAIRVQISCIYTRQHKEDLLEVYVRVLGMKVFELKAPIMELNLSNQTFSFTEEERNLGKEQVKKKKWSFSTIKKFIQKSREWLRHFPKFKHRAEAFLRKVTVTSFTWHTELGTGDAARTAQLAGMLWGVKGFLLGWVTHRLNWQAHNELAVHPHFQAMGFAVSFSCIASFRLGHVIYTGLLIALGYRSRKKNSNQTANAQAL